MEAALIANKDPKNIPQILNSFYPVESSEFVLQKHLKQINDCFSAPTIEGILNNLEKDNSDWAKETIEVRCTTSYKISACNLILITNSFALQTLRSVSPTSLKITQRELALGGRLSLAQCLQMEYRLAVHHVEESDFHEGIYQEYKSNLRHSTKIIEFLGVRALLIDKDNNPEWNPKTIEAVSDERVKSFFGPLSNNTDLIL